MSSQIFKNSVPINILFQLLDKISIKNDTHYVFNIIAFKKGVYTNEIALFFEQCKPYYHLSKRNYLEKKITYNSFTTVLRQICKNNNIKYTSQIKYDKSKYNIIYYIYF